MRRCTLCLHKPTVFNTLFFSTIWRMKQEVFHIRIRYYILLEEREKGSTTDSVTWVKCDEDMTADLLDLQKSCAVHRWRSISRGLQCSEKSFDLLTVLLRKTVYQHKCLKRTNRKTQPICSIAQQLQIDLWRSFGVNTTTKLVWLTGLWAQSSHSPQQPCNQKDNHFKICKIYLLNKYIENRPTVTTRWRS